MGDAAPAVAVLLDPVRLPSAVNPQSEFRSPQ
jgi:hypothetical protein